MRKHMIGPFVNINAEDLIADLDEAAPKFQSVAIVISMKGPANLVFASDPDRLARLNAVAVRNGGLPVGLIGTIYSTDGHSGRLDLYFTLFPEIINSNLCEEFEEYLLAVVQIHGETTARLIAQATGVAVTTRQIEWIAYQTGLVN